MATIKTKLTHSDAQIYSRESPQIVRYVYNEPLDVVVLFLDRAEYELSND